MNEIIWCVLGSIICFSCGVFGGYMLAYNSTSTKPVNVSLMYPSDKITISSLQKMEALKKFVANIDIPEDSKYPILKTIQIEYDYIERKSMIELGRETYKKSQEKKGE